MKKGIAQEGKEDKRKEAGVQIVNKIVTIDNRFAWVVKSGIHCSYLKNKVFRISHRSQNTHSLNATIETHPCHRREQI